jgi:hypothetical protein
MQTFCSYVVDSNLVLLNNIIYKLIIMYKMAIYVCKNHHLHHFFIDILKEFLFYVPIIVKRE